MLTFIMKRKRDLSSDSKSNGREEEESNGVEGPLAILWDIENCCIPSGLSPEIAVDNTRKYLRRQGINAPITLFSAYGDFGNRSSSQTESCQRSGVNLIHVPNRKKDAADIAIVVDMLFFAMDNPPPSSILLISGDVDFAAALHKLGQRGHSILVATTNLTQTSYALLSAAKFVWEWPQMASNGNFQISTQRVQPQSLPNGGGLPSETKIESYRTHMMQPSEIEVGDCGLPSQITTKPYPISSMPPCDISLSTCWLPYQITKPQSTSSVQPTTKRPSDLDNVKKELVTLLSKYVSGIRLSNIASKYKQTFGKPLVVKNDYGCTMRGLLNRIGNGIYVQGRCAFLRPQGS